MEIRDYQAKAVTDVIASLRAGRRPCLQMPTGTGKTVVAREIISALIKDGTVKKVLFVVPTIELVNQAVNVLGATSLQSRWQFGDGVYAACRESAIRRLSFLKPDLVIFDECHIGISQQQRLLSKCKDPLVFGLTATPETNSLPGPSAVYDHLITTPPISDFIRRGWLSECDYRVAYFNKKNLKTRMGDYTSDSIGEELLSQRSYLKCKEWLDSESQAQGRPLTTLVCCSSVESAITAAESMGGEYVAGDTSLAERSNKFSRFRSGKLQILTNCNLISYGFDAPECDVVILLRPTKSRALYLQMIGRAMRLTQHKKKFIVLDAVNNFQNFNDNGNPYPYSSNSIRWNFDGLGNEAKGSKASQKVWSPLVCRAHGVPCRDYKECPCCSGAMNERVLWSYIKGWDRQSLRWSQDSSGSLRYFPCPFQMVLDARHYQHELTLKEERLLKKQEDWEKLMKEIDEKRSFLESLRLSEKYYPWVSRSKLKGWMTNKCKVKNNMGKYGPFQTIDCREIYK